MDEHIKNIEIRRLLSDWYNLNKRDLPWRNTRNPYLIWISEIILQQTRVVQGYDYFQRFVQNFPSVEALAKADEQEVLKLWQGLGYYSRARNLHIAAKSVVQDFGGTFPDNYKDILSLKGVGDYTAAAIASFAYSLPYAVVDGNVYRVLSRLYAIEEPIDTGKGKKLFALLAQDLLDKENPAIHNQAIMELGALQCTPVNPVCHGCPLHHICLAYNSATVPNFPVKKGKTSVKWRFFNYFNIQQGAYMYLNKRVQDDIWKNLYELPLIETSDDTEIENLKNSDDFRMIFNNLGEVTINPLYVSLKHVLSHRIIYAKFYEISISDDSVIKNGYIRIRKEDLHEYPISRLVEKYIEKQNEH